MSFIGAALPVQILIPEDKRTLGPFYTGDEYAYPPIYSKRTISDADSLGIDDFRTPWWPDRSGLVGDGAISDVQRSEWWQQPYPVSGCNGRLGFNGIARDAYGSPAPGALVWLLRVSTSEITAAVVADGNGAYIATTPYTDAHILIVSGAGGTTGGASAQLLPG